MEKKNEIRIIEMEKFLQSENLYCNNEKYILGKEKSQEVVPLNSAFNPFKARHIEHPVSNAGTLMHLLKACLGTGIISMPFAFKCSGLIVGVIGTIFASVICTHCAYTLVVSAHELYRRSGKTSFTLSDVAEEAFLAGPPCVKPFAHLARQFVDSTIFLTYFGVCSAFSVIIAKNFDKVTAYYWGTCDTRIYLLILLIPLLILAYVPNLKYFAPVSVASNVLMAVGLAVTCYYLVNKLPRLEDRRMTGDISEFPTFFSITIYALQAIGIVMPLENNMKHPEKLIGICGVLNKGMCIVTMLYIFVGFLGYFRFGEITEANVTLNLPEEEYAAQVVQILISLSIYGTFGLPFLVCFDIPWKAFEHRFQKHPTLANYILRTALLIGALLVAIAVPNIGPFVGILGALCLSFLGIVLPITIEIVTFWEKGFGSYNWKIFKNLVVVASGLFAMVFGTRASLQEIIEMYS